MSSVGQPPPDPRFSGPGTPFDEAPRDLPAPRRGCSRMALAGCAVVVLLVGLGVLTLMMKAGDVVNWSLKQIRTEIERTLPDDLPQADQERLGRAFDAVSERLESGELDALGFQELQTPLMRFARLGRAPTREEVDDLATALERFAGLTTEIGNPKIEPSDPAVPEPSTSDSDDGTAASEPGDGG